MPAGAPRTVSLPPEEMISLGEEMVLWVKKNKATILHLNEWYSIEKGITFNEWDTFHKRPEFIKYYEQAMAIIGNKYLDDNSNVRDSITQRWQRVYFKDLKREEDDHLKYKSDLNKEIEEEKTKQINLIQYGKQK